MQLTPTVLLNIMASTHPHPLNVTVYQIQFGDASLASDLLNTGVHFIQ